MPLSWLTRFLAPQSEKTEPEPIEDAPINPLVAGERIYAIGDIHGRSDLLDQIWAQIADDLERYPAPVASIVYLGDYIDRGPDSRGVLDRLINPPATLPPATALMGNHELMMIQFIEGADLGDALRSFGGFETLRSYGVEPTQFPGLKWADGARESFQFRLPPEHRAFLENLTLTVDRWPYFFCHAGVKPDIPLSQQSERALLWIRGEFLNSEADFGRIVVHGHTPVDAPDIRRNRINLDTKAYLSGTLTCAVLELDILRFLSTGETTPPVPETG